MPCTGTFPCLKRRVIKFLDQDRKLIPDEKEEGAYFLRD
jgi:hypothetical protein